MEADRCRTDAQACKGCMTRLAILAGAARGRLAERAEELRPGALRLGQINGVGCYAVQDHGQRVVGTVASQAGMPQWLQRPYFARPEDCGFDTGLEH